ncbi:MAG: UDP-N-acetylmuramate dehydrogenase [Oscillospiraceae bacterium]|nr:UDP-N-acetylmuramate dehydrogenase [Oscillospiraceae bacterium]
MKIKQDFNIKEFNTFKLNCVCEKMVVVENWIELKEIIAQTEKYFILGNGSNILCPEYYDGAIIMLGNNFRNIELVSEKTVNVGASVMLSELCNFALKHSLTGLEWSYGIPGSVGGAVYMNAGAYGGEIKNNISEVDCYNIENQNCNNIKVNNTDFSYRYSVFMDKKNIILNAVFNLEKGDNAEIKQKMNENLRKRKDKQPLSYPSAGSFFKRPVTEGEPVYAAALIEQCGLKGFKIGGAMVSDKHAGFVVNVGNSTFEDIEKLAEYVQKKVFEETGYFLEREPEILK